MSLVTHVAEMKYCLRESIKGGCVSENLWLVAFVGHRYDTLEVSVLNKTYLKRHNQRQWSRKML